MVESVRGLYRHFGQAKILRHIHVVHVGDDVRMFDGIGAVFIHPRVKGRHVLVPDGLPFLDVMVEFDGIGPFAKKGISGLQGFNDGMLGQKCCEVRILLALFLPIALPLGNHVIARGHKFLFFRLSGAIAFLKRSIATCATDVELVLGETTGTSVLKTAVEFVHGRGPLVEPVHQRIRHAHFPAVVHVPNAISLRVRLSQTIISPRQPSSGFERLRGLGPFPTVGWLHGHGLGLQMTFPPVAIAGRGDGDAFLHGVKGRLSLEFVHEFLPPRLEEFNVRFAITLHVSTQIEDVPLCHFGRVPSYQFLPFLGRHAVGIVIVQLG